MPEPTNPPARNSTPGNARSSNAGGAIPAERADASSSTQPHDDDDLPPAAAPARTRAAQPKDAPPCPAGAALFQNTSSLPVKFTLRDEGNRPQVIKAAPGEFCIVPVEYADLIPRRAPQLEFIARKPRDPDSAD